MTQRAPRSKPQAAAPQREAPAVAFQRGERMAAISVDTRGASYDPETREFEFVLATEAPCRSYRYAGWDYYEVDEVLPMRGLQDIDKLVGAPILNSHSRWSLRDVIGVITSARIEGRKLVCTGRLSSRDEIEDIRRDVEEGILTNMSVGFERIAETEKTREGEKPLVTVDKWRAIEASIVAVPADNNASIRGEQTMSNRAPKAGQRAANDTAAEDEDKEGQTAAPAKTEDDSEDEARAAAVAALRAAVDVLTGTRAPAPKPQASGQRDATAVAGLRGIAQRKGNVEDFDAMVAAGATLDELRSIAVSAIRSNTAEIAPRSSAPEASQKRETLIPFSETAAGKRAAARAAR